MNNLKKLIAVLLCLVLAAGLLAACSGGGDNQGSNPSSGGESGSGDKTPADDTPKEKITLTVWCSQEDQAMTKEMCQAYAEANPQNTYKFLFGVQSESDAADKVLNDPESGPDLFSFASDQINKLIQAGALARLGGTYLDSVKAADSAESVDACTVKIDGEDRVYAYPCTGDNTYFMYYDKSVFTENDVKSLDKMLEIAKQKNKLVAFKLYDDGWYLSSFFFADPELKYSVTYDKDLTETAISINYDSAKGLEVMKALRGYFANSALSSNVDDSKIIAGIQSGTIAACVTGTWNRTAIKDAWGSNMATAVLPTATIGGREVKLNGFFGYKLYGVNGYSKNKAEAHKLALWLTNEANQLKRFQTRGLGPTNKTVMQSSQVKSDPIISVVLQEAAYFRSQKGVPSTYWTPMGSLTKQFVEADDPMTVTDATLQELLNSLCSQIRK